MSGHTPGPWSAQGVWIFDAEDHPVAKCNYRRRGVEGAKANACLIAAAPELLEAAVWVLNAVSGVRRDGNDDLVDSKEYTAALNALLAAANKAEGR